MIRVFLAMLPFVAAISFEGSIAAGAEKKTTVPFCSTKNLTERTVSAATTVTDHSFWLLIVTNHGTTACSLSGIPRAQPVAGLQRTPIGPYASTNRIPSRGGLVILPTDKGVAYVQYMMGATRTYPSAECVAQHSDGVVVTFHTSLKILLALYFPLSKDKVCSKLRSTSITGVAAGTGGY
jgi:hypothetical protein